MAAGPEHPRRIDGGGRSATEGDRAPDGCPSGGGPECPDDPGQSGMLPCLRRGPGVRLFWSVSSAVMIFGRVSWGTITSSM